MKNYNTIQLWNLRRRTKRLLGWYCDAYRPTVCRQDFFKKSKKKEINEIKQKFILEAYMKNIPPIVIADFLGLQESYVQAIINKERYAV